MFLTLLAVTFLIAAVVSFVAARAFDRPIRTILDRIIRDEISGAWHRYILFALYVVGLSGGVRIYSLEQYIMPRPDQPELELNTERWVLEVYRTVIETLQSIAWMLLVFFLFALIAYVITRGFEIRSQRRSGAGRTEAP